MPENNEIPVLRLTIGRLHLKRIRDLLNACRFMGLNIDWIESGGWLEHDFLVRGPLDDLTKTANELNHYKSNYFDHA